jgi:hypothetical protein
VIHIQEPIRSAKRPWGRLPAVLLSRPASIFLVLPLVLAALAVNPQFAAAQEDSAGEYELKAAIFYNLTRFVDWPDSAFPGPQAPIVVCILGRDPFGDSLASMAPKQAANGRLALIHRIQQDKDARDCHVLYISSSERKNLAHILSALNGSSVLTVGEIARFATRGGMIQFGLQDKQVRFDINLDAASRVGLKISSRLLVLARIVSDQNHGPEAERATPASQSVQMSIWQGPSHEVHDDPTGEVILERGGKPTQVAVQREGCDSQRGRRSA